MKVRVVRLTQDTLLWIMYFFHSTLHSGQRMTGMCVSSFYFRETVLRSAALSRRAFLCVFMRFLAPRRDPRDSVARSGATECTLLTRLPSRESDILSRLIRSR